MKHGPIVNELRGQVGHVLVVICFSIYLKLGKTCRKSLGYSVQ